VNNGVEIGMEPAQARVFVGSNVQGNNMEEEHQETTQTTQRNNAFMTRNMKVREWTPVNREYENGEDEIREDMVTTNEEKTKSISNSNIHAKEVEAVETLKRKLEYLSLCNNDNKY